MFPFSLSFLCPFCIFYFVSPFLNYSFNRNFIFFLLIVLHFFVFSTLFLRLFLATLSTAISFSFFSLSCIWKLHSPLMFSFSSFLCPSFWQSFFLHCLSVFSFVVLQRHLIFLPFFVSHLRTSYSCNVSFFLLTFFSLVFPLSSLLKR